MFPINVLNSLFRSVVPSSRAAVLAVTFKTGIVPQIASIDHMGFWLVVLISSAAVLTVTLKRGVRPQIASIDYNNK